MEEETGSIADYLERTSDIPIETDMNPSIDVDVKVFWTFPRILIAIVAGVFILFLISYIYYLYYHSDYFIKNTYDNDFDFIRSRLGLKVPEKKVVKETKKVATETKKEKPHVAPARQKGGWCYIGEDRGNRSCAYVGVRDKCMSQEIYASQDKCVHPNLRFD